MEKAVFNCKTGKIEKITCAEEDIVQAQVIATDLDEKTLLNSLIPTEKEILMAEIEIQTIEILTEGGLL